MAINTEVVPLEEDRVRLDVAVPQDEVDKRIDRTAKRLGREIRVPGFRPGKVPVNVVIQRFGRETVIDEMLRESIGDWYRQAVADTGVRTVADPDLDIPEGGLDDGVKFTATVQLRPKATLGDYKGIEVRKGEPEIPEGAVEAELDRLRDLAARLDAVERPAAEGDFVTVDFDGLVDGEPLASATARDYLVELGGQRLVGAFSDRLVGMSAGESKKFPIDYPDTDGRAELAGKTVHYTVTVKGVQAKILPDWTDELAAQVSEFDTVDELRASIEARLLEEAEAEVSELFRRSVIDQTVLRATINVPEVMIANRIESILHETAHRLPQGVTLADYVRATGSTMEKTRQALAPEAEMAIRRELTVEAVAETEAIAVTDEEVEAQVRTDAEASGRDPELLLSELNKVGGFEALREDMVMRKAVDFLLEQVTPISVGLAEARESLWTPENPGTPVAPEGGGALWTPDSPPPKKGSRKQ